MFHANYFRHGLTQSIGDTAIAYSLTAARWGVLAVDRVHAIATHPRTVQAAKVAVWCLYLGAVVAYALGQTVRIYAQHWVDAQVSASLPAEVAPVAAEMTADPFAPEVNPLPVVVAPVPALDDEAKKLEVSRLESLTIRQLKAAAKGKVPGYGRMTKAQLVQALAG